MRRGKAHVVREESRCHRNTKGEAPQSFGNGDEIRTPLLHRVRTETKLEQLQTLFRREQLRLVRLVWPTEIEILTAGGEQDAASPTWEQTPEFFGLHVVKNQQEALFTISPPHLLVQLVRCSGQSDSELGGQVGYG